jgi:hypothetical protein
MNLQVIQKKRWCFGGLRLSVGYIDGGGDFPFLPLNAVLKAL